MGKSMLKRLLLTFGIIAVLLSPAYPAGTIAFSLSQQLDSLGNPLNGGKLYFFQAGTTTPQNAYSDSALTLPLPNPITLDSAGRVPQFFLADGTIKIRLTNSAGVTQVAADGVMVIGASSGTGSGSVVDPTTVIAVGDIKTRYGTGVISGFVRLNGRTIGSATSGATERANADCQELFEYLWTADANLTVSTGRGATAAADWAANKTIALPDGRGRVLAAMDDMGSSAAGRLTTALSGVNGLILGASGGSQNQNIAQNQLPNATLALTGTVSVASTVSNIVTAASVSQPSMTSGGVPIGTLNAPTAVGQITSTGSLATGATASINGGVTQQGLIMVQPTLTITNYMKL